MNSSYDICTTGTKKPAEKIELSFEDQIYSKKKFKHKLFPWVRIDELKKELAQEYFHRKLSWRDLRFFHKNIELSANNKRVLEYNIEPEGIIIITSHALFESPEKGIINQYQLFETTPEDITTLIIQVASGLSEGLTPKLSEDGTSGSYLLENSKRKKVAIFKPFDQEPCAPNNPRGLVGKLGDPGIRKGVLSGEAATREVAAYLLDWPSKYHQVPVTTYIEFYHPAFRLGEKIENEPIVSMRENDLKLVNTKHGSLQEFVESQGVSGDFSFRLFDLQEIEKIAILDLRILNCDRNEANILVKKLLVERNHSIKSKLLQLIPIDHGLSFPDNFEIYDSQLIWMSYSQIQQPLTPKARAFIDAIDPIADMKKLREKLGFREICLRNFWVAETFLKKAVTAGFNLREIGTMMYRLDTDDDDDDEPSQEVTSKSHLSELEKLVATAQGMYSLVQDSDIRPTIQHQINLIKTQEQEQEQDQEQEQEQQRLKKKQNDRLNHPPQIQTLLQRDTAFPQTLQSPLLSKANHNNFPTSLSQQSHQPSGVPNGNQDFNHLKDGLVMTAMTKTEGSSVNGPFKRHGMEKSPIPIIKMTKQLTDSELKGRPRNVSLPHLKIPEQNGKEPKYKKRRRMPGPKKVEKSKAKNEPWSEVFYHYFENVVDQYLAKKTKKRTRFMSVTLDQAEV